MRRAWLAVRGRPVAEPRHFDVVIVGAGIAGASLAVALSGAGLSIALVEAQVLDAQELPLACDVHTFDPRVSALTPRSRAFLEKLGAWEAIAAYRYCAYHHMTVWDAQGTGQIEFDRAEVDAPALGYIVENRTIVSALLGRVRAAADISLLQSGCAAVLHAAGFLAHVVGAGRWRRAAHGFIGGGRRCLVARAGR